ncbi:MAG: hypothetical protein AAF215_04735 [Cyanobacteria bacterium P01_A01_bin.123]
MLAYDFMPQQPYVSRPEAEEFLAALDIALKSPADNPVVFHVWGIGEVGKSTLTRKVKAAHQDTAKIAEVSFGLTEGIDEPRVDSLCSWLRVVAGLIQS